MSRRWQKTGERPSCGQTRLLREQHNSPDPPDQERYSFAALQHNFPEAAVQNGLAGLNLNRLFATTATNVSQANEAEIARLLKYI